MFDFIVQSGPYSERVARYYFHQLVDAIDYIHSKGISHRDIKPDNLMFQDELTLKLADFGFSGSTSVQWTFTGTKTFMCPELLKGEFYHGHWADIFALAVVLFVMVAACPPFEQANPNNKIYLSIWANRPDYFWKFHSQNRSEKLEPFSESFKSLMNFMMQYDPIWRPSLAEIVEHEWFKEPYATQDEVWEDYNFRRGIIEEMTADSDFPDLSNFDSLRETTAFRSIENATMEELLTTERNLKSYSAKVNSFTKFLSKSQELELFNASLVFFSGKTKEIEISESDYELTAKILLDKSKEIDVIMKVNIQKFDDTRKIVEATFVEGNRFTFNKVYKEMKEYFGGYVNATKSI